MQKDLFEIINTKVPVAVTVMFAWFLAPHSAMLYAEELSDLVPTELTLILVDLENDKLLEIIFIPQDVLDAEMDFPVPDATKSLYVFPFGERVSDEIPKLSYAFSWSSDHRRGSEVDP